MAQHPTIRLATGAEIPCLGLGVFRAGEGGGTRDAVRWALEVGYRHIDTAKVYQNEREVGEAIRASGIARDALFVTTKLWRDEQGYDRARRAFETSLRELDIDYVDLYLMHWPMAEQRLETWRGMESLIAGGRCKAIGVSNFTVADLESLLEASDVVPAVNQIELHPFLQQSQTVEFCRSRSIAVQGWAPLTRGRRFDDPTIVAIAGELERTPAQVLIRWSLQKGFITIPKSSNRLRIAENADVFDFELDPSQLRRLDALDEGYRISPGWDPSSRGS